MSPSKWAWSQHKWAQLPIVARRVKEGKGGGLSQSRDISRRISPGSSNGPVAWKCLGKARRPRAVSWPRANGTLKRRHPTRSTRSSRAIDSSTRGVSSGVCEPRNRRRKHRATDGPVKMRAM